MCTPVCYDSGKVHSRGMTMDSFSPFFIKMELENDVHRERDHLIGHVLPSRPSDESLSVVEVEVPVLSMWQKSEVYLQMISVAMLIVAVTFVGFLLRFFSEIIIPMVLALFLFQISKVVVLWLHRPILPYFTFEEKEVAAEQETLLSDGRASSVLIGGIDQL